MFIRTGTAIIELDRIKKCCKNKRFMSDYFSPDEIRFFVSHELSTALIAENYCVKMALVKAVGMGFKIVKAREITVLRDRLGAPYVATDGMAKMMEQREGFVFNVSVAHCKNYATASVIITK